MGFPRAPHEVAVPGQSPQTQSTPAVSSGTPSTDSSQSAGPGNASEVADAGLGAPVCEEGIEGLRSAVDSGDGDEAWTLVQSLSATDLAELKGDNTLAERVMALVGPERAASVLYMLQYPLDIWLQYADFHCASSQEALSTVLSDVGICDASDIAAHIAEISGLPAFQNAALMDPLILASPPEDQAALISTAEGVSFFTSFHSESPLCVLTDWAAESAFVLDSFLTSEPARNLILCDPGTLNDHILTTWAAAGEWYRALGAALVEDLDGLVSLAMADWATALVEVLSAGAAEDQALLPLPADALTRLVLGAIGASCPDELVTVCRALAYAPHDAMRFFFEQGLLTLDAALALLAESTLEQQGAVSGDPDIAATLMPLAYIEDVLPLMTASMALALVYPIIPHLREWVEMDMARFETIARALPDSWVAAFVGARNVQPLLDFAVADPAGWRALVSDAQFQAVLGILQKPCEEAAVEGLWALWTDANRSVDTGYALFHTVFGIRLWSTGTQPTFTASDWTDTTTNITYERRGRFDTIQPDQTALNTYLGRIKLLPRGLVTASSVGFGNRLMVDFKKKTPAPPDAAWGATKAAVVSETYDTSVTFSNHHFILMNVTSAGAIPANLGVGNAEVDMNPGGVGGKRQTVDAGGNTVAAPSATDQTLSWFQNHSQHENGHAVGARAYRGVPRKGDDEAKKFAKWQNSSEAQMRAAYFAGVPAQVTDVKDNSNNDHTLSSIEIGKYLTTIAQTGAEPGTSAAAGNPGRVVSVLPGMTMQQRVDGIIFSSVGTKDLPFHVDSILNNGQSLPDSSYETTNFTPSGSKVHIWSDYEGGFRKYDKAVLDDMVPVHGWYSQSAHYEMFAEIYCMYYSTAAHTVPAAHNGTDWTRWFALLEASPDAQVQAGVPPVIAGVGAPPDPAAAAAPGPGGGGGGGGGAAGGGGAGVAPAAASGGGGIVGTDPTEGIDAEGTPL